MMKKLKKELDDAIGILGAEIIGKVPKPLYYFLRRYSPMLCVDVVLIPKDEKPSVLLVKRGNEAVASNQYYMVGGRIGKDGKILNTIHNKLRTEINLDYKIKLNEIIGLGLPSFPPDRNKRGVKRDYSVFTPAVCFIHRIPDKTYLEKLKPNDGNVSWKIFNKLYPNWDEYVIHAVAKAWDYYYEKSWRKTLSKRLKIILSDYTEFIPLEFDP